MRPLYLFVALVATCAAQNPPEAPYRIGGGVSAPIPIYKPPPEYSEKARRAKFEGTVVLMIVVDEKGMPRDIKVIRPLGLGLDEKAIEAVGKWRFKPGMKEGQPVPVQATVEVNFRLLKELRWRLADISFRPPEGASAPVVVHDKYPPPVSMGSESSITLSFDVDEQGVPANVRIEKSSYGPKDDEILAAVREWRFTPGMKDGRAVVVPCTASFVLSERPPKTTSSAVAPASVGDPAKTIDPAKLTAIEELLSLMKMDRTMESFKTQIQGVMNKQIERSMTDIKSDDPEKRAALAKEAQALETQIMDLIWDRMNMEKLKPDLVKIYDETFTMEEINGAVAFYKSPAGSAIIEKLPQVIAKTMTVAQRQMADVMPTIKKKIDAWQTEMNRKYSDSLNGK